MTVFDINTGANVVMVGDQSTFQNDRGVIRHPGNVDSAGPLQAASSLGDGDSSLHGSLVHEGGGAPYAQRSVAAGNFALMTAEEYVIRRVTTLLAGVANTSLQSGGAQYDGVSRNSIHSISSIRTTYLQSLSWTAVGQDGQPSYTLTTSDTLVTFFSISAGASAIPNDTFPTAAIPGELVIRDGSPNPVQKDYEAKTSA